MKSILLLDGLLISGHLLALVLKKLRTGFSQESIAGQQLKIWRSVPRIKAANGKCLSEALTATIRNLGDTVDGLVVV
jgi:hypothetical protein